MKLSVYRWLCAATLCLFVGSSYSADPSPSTAAADPLTQARELIASKNWAAATEELKRVNLPEKADWNNLMGYTARKSVTPDLVAAERYYDAALRIDPKHRGALEYSGELYLMKGDVGRAEERLKQLDKACFLSCEEHTDLKKAIAQYKSSSNKYVADK